MPESDFELDSTNEQTSKKGCQTKGCDGRGNTNGKSSMHRTQKYCPNFQVKSKNKLKINLAAEIAKQAQEEIEISIDVLKSENDKLLSEKMEALKRIEILESEKTIDINGAKIDHLIRELDEHKEIVQEKEQIINNLESKITKITNKLNEKREALLKKQTKIDSLNDQVQDFEKDLKELKKGQSDDIKNLKKEIDDYKQNLKKRVQVISFNSFNTCDSIIPCLTHTQQS